MIQNNLSRRIIIYEIIGFSMAIIVVWLDGLFDIPHHLFGQEGRLVNITESIFETMIVLVLGILVITLTSHLLHKIRSAGEMLRHREAYFRSLIENASDIILLLSDDGSIRYGSPSVERLLGYKVDSLLGQNISTFIHSDDTAMVMNALAQSAQNPGPGSSIEFQMQDQTGSWRMLEAVSNNLLEDAEIAGVVVNARDITRRKQLEEQLNQAQKMEAVGRLAGGVAHNFNNLLTIITGYTGLILASSDINPPLRQDMEQIKQAADRAATLTRQILAFSCQQMFELRLVDLNVVIADMAKMLQQLLGADIKLVINLNRALWSVKADSSQMAQVIINMALNARDAMPQGGRLTLETNNMVLDQAAAGPPLDLQPGPYVTLTISDQGLGMDAKTLSHLFEPFFTTKGPEQGNGLGLAISHGIIAQSGGHISVNSQPKQGATFKIYLPAAEGDVELLQPEQELGSPEGLETILVVEDEDAVREMMSRTLRENGYIVLEANHALAALQVSRQYLGLIHLLVTDVAMPGINGRQLAEYLTLLCPEMRVLYISGYTDNIIAHHGVKDAGMAFLAKPFIPTELARRVREVLDAPQPR